MEDLNKVDLKTLVGKHLLFTLGNESYGVCVLRVKEIMKLLPITPMPQLPSYVKGVINLRGKVIPVVDLREKFGITHGDNTDRTCIIVVMVNAVDDSVFKTIGIIVDGVEEVANIKEEDLEDAPDFGGKLSIDYITGIAKIKGQVKSLLDIDKVIRT